MTWKLCLEYTDGETDDFPFLHEANARTTYDRSRNRPDVVTAALFDGTRAVAAWAKPDTKPKTHVANSQGAGVG